MTKDRKRKRKRKRKIRKKVVLAKTAVFALALTCLATIGHEMVHVNQCEHLGGTAELAWLEGFDGYDFFRIDGSGFLPSPGMRCLGLDEEGYGRWTGSGDWTMERSAFVWQGVIMVIGISLFLFVTASGGRRSR